MYISRFRYTDFPLWHHCPPCRQHIVPMLSPCPFPASAFRGRDVAVIRICVLCVPNRLRNVCENCALCAFLHRNTFFRAEKSACSCLYALIIATICYRTIAFLHHFVIIGVKMQKCARTHKNGQKQAFFRVFENGS